jgi:hypothetical protein
VALTLFVQDWTGERDDATLWLAGILVACGFMLIIRDWVNMGPTIALQSCAVAAAAAWFLFGAHW